MTGAVLHATVAGPARAALRRRGRRPGHDNGLPGSRRRLGERGCAGRSTSTTWWASRSTSRGGEAVCRRVRLAAADRAAGSGQHRPAPPASATEETRELILAYNWLDAELHGEYARRIEESITAANAQRVTQVSLAQGGQKQTKRAWLDESGESTASKRARRKGRAARAAPQGWSRAMGPAAALQSLTDGALERRHARIEPCKARARGRGRARSRRHRLEQRMWTPPTTPSPMLMVLSGRGRVFMR